MELERTKEGSYAIIPNRIIWDKEVSSHAKGVYLTIMSLPDDWSFNMNGLITLLKEGRQSVYNAINELIEHGYCERIQIRKDNGDFGEVKLRFNCNGNARIDVNSAQAAVAHTTMAVPTIWDPPTKTLLNTNNTKDYKGLNKNKTKDSVPTFLKLENGKIADLSAAGALLDVFTEWMQYKHERRERYKSQRSIDIKLRELREWSGNDPEVARQIVERSIGNNYAGLYNPNESSRKAQGQGHETARAKEDADPDFDRHYEELKEQVRQREYNQRFGR